MEDIFKTLGNIFNPTPTEELEKICDEAGLSKTKTPEKCISEERPTLYDVWYEKCSKANEWGIDKFIFCHEGKYYLVEWKKKGNAFEFWTDPIEIEKL